MTIQYINTGSGANAGNGDSLRSAFVKVNNNFTYLSTASFGSAGTGYTGSQGNIGYTGSAPNLPPISVTAPAPGSIAYYSSQNAILGAARLLVDDLDGSLTISGSGVGAPALNVIQNLYTPVPIVRTSQFHENTDASNFSFLRARGTLTAPQTVQVGDEIGEISWDTYDSTGTYVVGALITTLVDQAPAPGRVPMSLRFTTHNGTDFGTRMFISSTGTVRFNRLAALGTATTIDIASSFIPSRDSTYNLGSTSSQWRSLYVSSSTIYIGGAALGINTASEVTVNGNPVTGSGSPYKLVNNNLEVALSNTGTLTVPSPSSNLFNITFSAENYVPTIGKPTLTLTDTPWEIQGQYSYGYDGECELAANSIWPVLVNPGYESGDEFTFDETVHGVPGFILTVILNDVVLPGGAGWTANLAFSQPPEYPSTITSLGAVKLTSNNNNWIFGSNGALTVPGAIISQGYQLNLAGSEYSYNIDRYLRLRDGDIESHIHLDTPDNSLYDIILGDDGKFVRVDHTGTVVIGTVNFLGSPTMYNTWTFSLNGDLALPENGGIVFDRNNTSIRVGMGFHIASGEGIDIQAIDQTDPENLVYKHWTFATDGKLTLPGTVEYSNGTLSTGGGILTPPGNDYIVGTQNYQTVSAEAMGGTSGQMMLIDTTFVDDITVVQPGWQLNAGSPEAPVWLAVAMVIPGDGMFSIDVPGFEFVASTIYTFRNPVPLAYDWIFGNNGVLSTPASGTISHQNNDLKLEVVGTDVIVLRTAGGDLVMASNGDLDTPGALRVGGQIHTSSGIIWENGTGVAINNNSIDEYFIIATNHTTGTQRNWKFGYDGRLEFPDNTVQTTAYQKVSVPASSIGAPGDQAGDLAFSSGYIYYCMQDYVGSINLTALASSGNEVYVSSTDYAGDLVADFTINSTGWTYAGVTVTNVSVNNTFGPGYALTGPTSFGVLNGADYALVSPLTPNIWKRVAWSGDTW